MKIHFTSLGCPKNLIDSEQMLALLAAAGHRLTADPAEAEAAIVNTCAFIESAVQEAIDAILQLAAYKEEGVLRRLIVTGCLAQRFQEEILAEMPEIDAVLGTSSLPDILEALESEETGFARFADKSDPLPELDRVISTGPGWAYIKIADGCDNHCAYCVIPSIRGRFRSRPMDTILEEAKELAEHGVKELILVAQDVTRYGRDFKNGTTLAALLRELVKIEGLEWIRLHYLYPDEITDELIDVIAAEDKIVKYLDIPIQHVNDKILKAMNRRGNKDVLESLFTKLRQRIPGLVLRTSLICGLPGEGEAEFEELCSFLRKHRLERVGVFAFSPEEGTPAAEMEPGCDSEEAMRRVDIITDIQSRIMDDYNDSRMDTVMEVICEGFDRYAECYFGRTYADSPDVDGKVFFTSEEKLYEGQFVNVLITDTLDGDLVGEAQLEDEDLLED